MGIGQKIKELRQGQGISQAKLAKAIGYGGTIITYWENGVNQPTAEAITRLADHFDVSADYLLGRTERPEGKLYAVRPAFLNENEQLKQFIEMCFDPTTTASARLKDMLYKMMTVGGEQA